MDVLKAEKRTGEIKPGRLRADGLIPGCVYGGKLEETLMFQVPLGDAMQLVKAKAEGSKVTLELGEDRHITLLKEIARDPASHKIQHLSFQALVADEIVTSVIRVTLLNRDKVSGTIQQLLFEIPYSALPADMVETVSVDLAGMEIGDSISLADLDISKNEALEFLIEEDSLIVNVVEQKIIEEEIDEDEDSEDDFLDEDVEVEDEEDSD